MTKHFRMNLKEAAADVDFRIELLGVTTDDHHKLDQIQPREDSDQAFSKLMDHDVIRAQPIGSISLNDNNLCDDRCRGQIWVTGVIRGKNESSYLLPWNDNNLNTSSTGNTKHEGIQLDDHVGH